MTRRMRRLLGGVLAVAVLASAACVPSAGRLPRHPDVDLLEGSWAAYKAHFITADGRVVRPESGGDTVSEGQAYAMLRAAWMHDRATFDRVWRWTQAHLILAGRPRPALMAWHWGVDPDGNGHVIDANAATDADADAALALVQAHDLWAGSDGSASPYLAAARAILRDLIELTTLDAEGHRVLLAGEWADQRSDGRGVVLNPSYFAPASYRVFARLTGDARWLDLVHGTYVVLDAICDVREEPRGLPDWIRWRAPGAWTRENIDLSHGWDAVRIPWRIATDARWFRAADAARVLDGCLTPLARDRLGRTDGRDAYGAAPEQPLADAMWSFALTRPDERDRLLARVVQRGTDAPIFGAADRYYVNSLAYLPFLARAGRYAPPRTK